MIPSNPAKKSKTANIFRSFPRNAKSSRESNPAGVARKEKSNAVELNAHGIGRAKSREERSSESKSRSRRPLRGTSRPECCSLCSFPFSCLNCDKFRGGTRMQIRNSGDVESSACPAG